MWRQFNGKSLAYASSVSGSHKANTDDTALGSAIVTALMADARVSLDSPQLRGGEKNNEPFLPIASAGDAFTLPCLDWQEGPVDPDQIVLGFVDGISRSSRENSREEIGESIKSTNDIPVQPAVVRQHMHRWKEHVTRSLMAQLSVLHDVYHSAIIVEQQHTQGSEVQSTVISGSVSMAVFGLVFRHTCTETAKSASREQKNEKTWLGASDGIEGVTAAAKNSSLAHIHRVISSKMGTRNIPNGLRGVMLFENFLVSRHDTFY